MDALRAAAMMLGLVLHGAIPYMRAETEYWPVEDRATSPVYDDAVLLIHCFRIPLFFVLSGLFAAMLLRRIGTQAYLRRRALRLGVPFACGMAVILPLVRLAWVYGELSEDGPTSLGAVVRAVVAEYRDHPLHAMASTAHLWFLYYLILFTAVAGAAAWLLSLLRRRPAWPAMTRAGDLLAMSALGPVAMAAFTLPILETMPHWRVDTPLSIIPAWRPLLYYGVYFLFGCVLGGGRRERLTRFGAWWPVYLAVSLLVGFPLLLHLLPRDDNPLRGTEDLEVRAIYVLVAWFLVAGFTGLAQYLASGPIRWVRYMADASYWLYLVHMPVVILIAAMLRPLAWGPHAKFGAELAISFTILLLSYHWCVRYTIIGRVLNGPRHRYGAIGDRPSTTA